MPHVDVHGVRVYYEITGSGPGTPAALIMGLGGDAHAWERVVPKLAESRRVLVLDNRGMGRSDKPAGPYSTSGLAADFAHVLDAAGIDVAHVAGISLGGMIAQEFALAHPARVRSLSLIATYAKASAETKELAESGAERMVTGERGGRDFGAMLAAVNDGSATLDLFKAFAFMMPLVFSPAFLMREAAYLQTFFQRSLGYGISGEGFAGQVAAVFAHDTVDRLGSLHVPTLVLTGTADRLIAPPHSRFLADRIPGARFDEIEGGTHGLNMEFPDHLAEKLAAFFAEHDAAPAAGLSL